MGATKNFGHKTRQTESAQPVTGKSKNLVLSALDLAHYNPEIPMISFDLEATSADPETARIIQIGIVNSEQGWEPWSTLVNPGFPITDEIAELTGITNTQLATAPSFREIAVEVRKRILGQTLVGFNCLMFDIPLLDLEFERCGIKHVWADHKVIDVGNLYKILNSRTLADAVRDYLPANEQFKSHDALSDATATLRVLQAMLQRHDLTSLGEGAIAQKSQYEQTFVDPHRKVTRDSAGDLVFATRRNRSVRVIDDMGYANWMLRHPEFPESTKRLIEEEIEKHIQQHTERDLFSDKFSQPSVSEVIDKALAEQEQQHGS